MLKTDTFQPTTKLLEKYDIPGIKHQYFINIIAQPCFIPQLIEGNLGVLQAYQVFHEIPDPEATSRLDDRRLVERWRKLIDFAQRWEQQFLEHGADLLLGSSVLYGDLNRADNDFVIVTRGNTARENNFRFSV